MMIAAILGGGVLFLALQIGALWYLSHTAPPKHLENSPLEARMLVLEEAVQRLPEIWREDVERANRHRARAEAAERRYRQQLETGEVGGGPAQDLRTDHADGSGGEALSPVREGLDPGQPPASIDQIRQMMLQARLNPFTKLRS